MNWWWIAVGLYVVGIALVFMLHTQMPVTFGLALVRAFAWPLWILFGWPRGAPLPMD